MSERDRKKREQTQMLASPAAAAEAAGTDEDDPGVLLGVGEFSAVGSTLTLATGVVFAVEMEKWI